MNANERQSLIGIQYFRENAKFGSVETPSRLWHANPCREMLTGAHNALTGAAAMLTGARFGLTGALNMLTGTGQIIKQVRRKGTTEGEWPFRENWNHKCPRDFSPQNAIH